MHYDGGTVTAPGSPGQVREMAGDTLLRCHAAYAVNPRRVRETGRFYIVTESGKRHPVPEKKHTGIADRPRAAVKREEKKDGEE
ncbi:MAG: hypothetical protein CW338_11055 [Clostridiales bacterium]|nr:hypothetical protein [Clostridiales bacterium]